MHRGASAILLVSALVTAGCMSLEDDLAPTATADIVGDLLTFVSRVAQVDAERWSGEPSILVMEDGTLLITGAGGFTRYVEDPTDIPGNAGQSYLWRSTDDGETWTFVDLGLPGPARGLLPYRNAILGVEGDLARDEAGRAYFVDLTMLAGNGLSVSEDSGATWLVPQNPLVGQPVTDRPWVAAFGDGHVYVKYLQIPGGFRVARSTDAGTTFLEDVPLGPCSQADMTVDFPAREVLVPCGRGTTLDFLRTGEGEMAWERVHVADLEGRVADFPGLVVAGSGQYVYVWREVFDENTEIRVAASTDRGATWTEPLTVSRVNSTSVFPWVDANPDGVVSVVWYETEGEGLPHSIRGTWYPMHAHMVLDSATGALSEPVVQRLTDESVHEGGICTSGLGCVLDGRSEDRRLLDFFEVAVDAGGRSHVTWTSTRTQVPTIWYGQVDRAPVEP